MIDLNNFRLITIPRWVQLSIIVLIIAAIFIDAGIGLISITAPDKKDWLPASLTLLGTMLPAVVIGLIFLFKHTGAEALQQKTRDVGLKMIPECLSTAMVFNPGPFISPETALRMQDLPKLTPVTVSANMEACDCRYRMVLPDITAPEPGPSRRTGKEQRIMYFMLELNVRHANISLCVPLESFSRLCGKDKALTAEGFNKWIELFHHTIDGAKENGYVVRPSLVQRQFGGIPYVSCVLAKPLKEEFLWDAAEQVYFTQDLMIMLRFYYSEHPSLFLPAEFEQAAA